jgi:DNA-binding MarR family transcriptional regulator
MTSSDDLLMQSVDQVISTLPGVWDQIRSNLRAAAITNFGISLEQFHVLRHIRRGYDSVAVLAEKKQISRPAVSQAVDELVRKGLVTRHPNPDDRRSVRLELTPYAREAMDENFDKNCIWMKDKMKDLTVEELTQVIQTMEILKKTFNPEESNH